MGITLNLKPNLKILHTESHRGWGGQEIRVLSECLWMKQHGHQPMLAASKKSQIYHKAKAAGLNVVPMSFTILTAISDFIRLRGLIKAHRPDVLNTHGNMDAKVGLTAALGLNVPCIIRSRHHSHPVTPSWYNKWMYRYLSHYIFTAAQCVTDQLSTDLAVEPSKVIMVPSGIIPPNTLPEKQEAMRDLQREFDLDPMARFVGSVAMLRDWKGHRFLLDGFARIADRFEHHHLVIVGDGDEMEALKRQREALGLSARIHFTGFRNNPWPCYRAFDVTVLGSTKNELMSQVLPQAMYTGCPVIGTRVGGIPDLLENGINGLLVEPGCAASLAEAISMTLTIPDAAQSRAQRAFKIVSQQFTIDAMGQNILGIYAQALAAAC